MRSLRRLAFPIAALLAIIALLYFSPGAKGSVDAVETCVTIYENNNTQGDHWQKCATGAAYNSNLTGDIAGLTGTPLCNTAWWPVAGNDWNDCVSAIVASFPTGYRAVFYRDANYLGPSVRLCWSGSTLPLQGNSLDDAISSWRVLSGSC